MQRFNFSEKLIFCSIKNKIYKNVKFWRKKPIKPHAWHVFINLPQKPLLQAPEMLQAVWVVMTLHIVLIHIMCGIAGWKHDQSSVRLHFPMTNSWVPYEIDCIRCPWFVILLSISWILCRWSFSLQLIIPNNYRKYVQYFHTACFNLSYKFHVT